MNATSADAPGQERTGETPPETVEGFVRPLLPVLWAVGGALLVVAIGIEMWAALSVLVVTHLFFAVLVYADVQSLRRQGLDWGASRHAWVLAALVLPFAAPAYYVYAGRRIAAANRPHDADDAGGEGDTGGEGDEEGEGTDDDEELEPTDDGR